MGFDQLFCQRKTDTRTDMVTLVFLIHFIIAIPDII